MAFLQAFEHDVFVSYAHVDNLPERDGEKGWVEQFERQLSVRLLKRFGEKVDVWHDPELDRAQVFDQVIENNVRRSGVMISLISNRYLRSDYCGQEIAWFRDQAQSEPSGLVVDGYLRIFPVLLYNLPPEQWPEACQGTSAFAFHDAVGEEFGEPLDPVSEAFQKQLRQLVEELHKVLTRLREGTGEPTTAPLRAAATGDPAAEPFRIFLAHPADDMGPTYRQLAAGLTAPGVELLCDVPPPWEEEPHRAAVREQIERADLAVHLLGGRPGEPLDDAEPEKTYPLEQLHVGLEHAGSQLVLMPDEVDLDSLEDEFYAALLHDLESKPRDAARLEMVRTGRHQMIDEVVRKRQRLVEASRRRTAAGGPATAFIDLHTSDLPHSADLVAFLARQNITPVMVPAADLSPSAGMNLFEDHLKKSCLFLVVFGTVARNWVELRLQEAFKLILNHRLPTRVGVFVAPPRKPPEQVEFPPLFDVADNMERFDPGTLEPLLAKALGSA